MRWLCCCWETPCRNRDTQLHTNHACPPAYFSSMERFVRATCLDFLHRESSSNIGVLHVRCPAVLEDFGAPVQPFRGIHKALADCNVVNHESWSFERLLRIRAMPSNVHQTSGHSCGPSDQQWLCSNSRNDVGRLLNVRSVRELPREYSLRRATCRKWSQNLTGMEAHQCLWHSLHCFCTRLAHQCRRTYI